MADPAQQIRKQLEDSIAHSISYSIKRAITWSVIYHSSRASMIVLSAIASAKAWGGSDVMTVWQAYAALVVAILAALDTWIQPGAKYRIHYEYDDEHRRLQDELGAIPIGDPDETSELQKLMKEREKVRERYRKALFHS
jgi:hypothetical protein